MPTTQSYWGTRLNLHLKKSVFHGCSWKLKGWKRRMEDKVQWHILGKIYYLTQQVFTYSLKLLIHSKLKILSFTQPHVIPIRLSTIEQKCLEDCIRCYFFMKLNHNDQKLLTSKMEIVHTTCALYFKSSTSLVLGTDRKCVCIYSNMLHKDVLRHVWLKWYRSAYWSSHVMWLIMKQQVWRCTCANKFQSEKIQQTATNLLIFFT